MPSNVRIVAIVEDDDLVRSATVSLIRSLGLNAVPFCSATQFLDAEQIDLGCIISDIHMPGMSGLDLVDYLRGQGSLVPVILMTAYPTEQIKALAKESGAQWFLEKPCEPDVLIDCLSDIFGPLED
jgi:FixJ family two-component response regulator